MNQRLASSLGYATRRFAEAAVDLLFPKSCVGCNQEGSFLCESCQEMLSALSHRSAWYAANLDA